MSKKMSEPKGNTSTPKITDILTTKPLVHYKQQKGLVVN